MPDEQPTPPLLTPIPYADESVAERKAKAWTRMRIQADLIEILVLLAFAAIFFGVRWIAARR